jgi:hypothetical protein
MNILTPSRIETLGRVSIRIVEHDGSNTSWTMEAYPFETILSIKQRISLHHSKDRKWLPNQLFLAEPANNGEWRTLEFLWPFSATLSDPLSVGVQGVPDSRIMEGSLRKPIFPTVLSGISVEMMNLSVPNEIHVWTLASMTNGVSYTDDVKFGGYFQLYFPGLKSSADIEPALHTGEFTEEETSTMSVFQEFRTITDERFARIESCIPELQERQVSLHDLAHIRFIMPTKTLEEGLEILFYESKPTPACPILRYFPQNSRSPPLLKMAASPSGIPVITDTKVLKTLLSEQPDTTKGDVLLFKVPIPHSRTPPGTAWTLRVFANGSAELTLSAPRKDTPVSYTVMERAIEILGRFLQSTPWSGISLDALRLVELTAIYEFTLQQQVKKPTLTEFVQRLDPFQPLFSREKTVEKTSSLALRWKAVSNYRPETNPIMNYITNQFLRNGAIPFQERDVKELVGNLSREFGIAPADAVYQIQEWTAKQAEHIVTDPDAPERAVAAHALGTLVSVLNGHPKYFFHVSLVESEIDLRRILTCLEVLVSFPSERLSLQLSRAEEKVVEQAERALSEQQNAANEVAAVPDDAEDATAAYDPLLDFDFLMGSAEEGAEEGAEGAEESADGAEEDKKDGEEKSPEKTDQTKLLEIQKDVRYPTLLKEDESSISLSPEVYISQYEQRDRPLFDYTIEGQKEVQLYSRSCQLAKQPNIMSPESYRRIRSIYGDSVHWLEAPLNKYYMDAVSLVSKSVGERIKAAKKRKLKTEDIVAMEKRALSIGIPLKNNASVMGDEMDEELKALVEFQQSKPLWVVTRAGSSRKHPNYYLCAKYWCMRDDLPLLESEFNGAKMHKTNAPKAPKTCPFCGGKPIKLPQTKGKTDFVVAKGETVLVRNPVSPDKYTEYAGYYTKVIHPNKYALPCCFVGPDNTEPPEGSEELPIPLVELPSTQQVRDDAEDAESASEKPAEEVATETILRTEKDLLTVFQDARIKLEYIPKRFEFLTKNPNAKAKDVYRIIDKDNKIEIKAKKILRALVLESEQYPFDAGKIRLLPQAVDTFLGQNRTTYLEGRKHGEIYTHPDIQCRAFFRIGLGVGTQNPGRMMLQLIAFARNCVSQILTIPEPTLTPEDILQDMFETNQIHTFYAFQQANSGTLVSEFADPTRSISDTVFQEWCGTMGLPLPQQRAYAMHVYKAWLNFQDYVRDVMEPKEWRLWEHLFAAPGLFSSTGVLILRITQDAEGYVHLQCPTMGVSPRSQIVKQPLMILYEDRKSQLSEPLVFYHGPDILLGVIDPQSPDFDLLSPSVRSAISGFYAQFLDPKQGCGRSGPLVHPWLLERSSASVPFLGSLLDSCTDLDLKPQYLLRDKTQRLVGLCVHTKYAADTPVYIPAVDDGTIDIELPSFYDVEALPTPPLQLLLNVLYGPSGGDATKGLAYHHKGLLPVQLRAKMPEALYTILETKCGCFMPIVPLGMSDSVPHVDFPALKKRSLTDKSFIDRTPWEEDLRALGAIDLSDAAKHAQTVLLYNPEEALDNAYQHLRLSLSRWLTTAKGKALKDQIVLLRAARSRLPLYELRKRGDLLLMDIVKRWIHVSEAKEQSHSLLRRDCLQIQKEGDCEGACSWSEGRCLIHASSTPRYVDPVYVLTARLVDELIRTHNDAQQILQQKVPRLTPPKGILHEPDTLTMAFEGRGDKSFSELGLLGRLPTKYTKGQTYPEEMTDHDVGLEETRQGIPLAWENVEYPPQHANTVRDPRLALIVFWSAFLEKPWAELQPFFTGPIQYSALANMKGIHMLFTEWDGSKFQLSGWIAPTPEPTGERQFILFDPDHTPLYSSHKGSYIFKESDLPTPIRQWLDHSSQSETVEGPVLDLESAKSEVKEPSKEEQLVEAIQAKNTQQIKDLLNAGANPNAGVKVALAGKSPAILMELIRRGAEVDPDDLYYFAKKTESKRALTLAIKLINEEIKKLEKEGNFETANLLREGYNLEDD